jgi:WD40 repeat protein
MSLLIAGIVQVIDVEHGHEVFQLQNTVDTKMSPIWAVATLVTRSETYGITGNFHGNMDVYSLSTGQFIRRLTGHIGLTFTIIGYDGTYTYDHLENSNGNGSNSPRSVQSSQVGQPHGAKSYTNGLQPIIISGSLDLTIRIWSVTTGEQISLLKVHSNNIIKLSLIDLTHKHGMNPLLISASLDKTIIIWDLVSLKMLRTLRGHQGAVSALSVCDESSLKLKYPVFVSYGADKKLISWSTSASEILTTFQYLQSPSFAVALWPIYKQSSSGTPRPASTSSSSGVSNSKVLVSGHDIDTSRQLEDIMLLTGQEDPQNKGVTAFYSLKTGELKRTIEGQVHNSPVWCITVLEECDLLATCSFADEYACLWRLSTGELLEKLSAVDAGLQRQQAAQSSSQQPQAASSSRRYFWSVKLHKYMDRPSAPTIPSPSLAQLATPENTTLYLVCGTSDSMCYMFKLSDKYLPIPPIEQANISAPSQLPNSKLSEQTGLEIAAEASVGPPSTARRPRKSQKSPAKQRRKDSHDEEGDDNKAEEAGVSPRTGGGGSAPRVLRSFSNTSATSATSAASAGSGRGSNARTTGKKLKRIYSLSSQESNPEESEPAYHHESAASSSSSSSSSSYTQTTLVLSAALSSDKAAVRGLHVRDMRVINDKNILIEDSKLVIMCACRNGYLYFINEHGELLFKIGNVGEGVDAIICFDVFKSNLTCFVYGTLSGNIKVLSKQSNVHNFHELSMLCELTYTAGVKSLHYVEHPNYVGMCSYLCSGHMDGSVLVWDLRRRALVHAFEGHKGMVFELQTVCNVCGIMDPVLISAGVDKKIIVWDMHTLFANAGMGDAYASGQQFGLNNLITNSASVHSLVSANNSSSAHTSFGGNGGGMHSGHTHGDTAYTSIPTFGAIEAAFNLDKADAYTHSSSSLSSSSSSWPRLSKHVDNYGGPAILALATQLFFRVLLQDDVRTDFIGKFLQYHPTIVLARVNCDVNFDRVFRQTSLLELAIVKQDQVCLHTIVNAWIYLLQPPNTDADTRGLSATNTHKSSTNNTHAHTLYSAQKQHISIRLDVRELLGLAESFPGEFCELVKHLSLIPAHDDCVQMCHRVNLRIGASLEIAHRESYCKSLWENYMKDKYPQGNRRTRGC